MYPMGVCWLFMSLFHVSNGCLLLIHVFVSCIHRCLWNMRWKKLQNSFDPWVVSWITPNNIHTLCAWLHLFALKKLLCSHLANSAHAECWCRWCWCHHQKLCSRIGHRCFWMKSFSCKNLGNSCLLHIYGEGVILLPVEVYPVWIQHMNGPAQLATWSILYNACMPWLWLYQWNHKPRLRILLVYICCYVHADYHQ